MARPTRLHPAAYRRPAPPVAQSTSRMNPLQRAGPLPLNPNPAPMRTQEGLRVGRPVSPMAFIRSRVPLNRMSNTMSPLSYSPTRPTWDIQLGQRIRNAIFGNEMGQGTGMTSPILPGVGVEAPSQMGPSSEAWDIVRRLLNGGE
jgi:hypothetical protein